MTDPKWLTLKICEKDRMLLYAYGFFTRKEATKKSDEVTLDIDHWVKIISTLRAEGNMKKKLAKLVDISFTMEMWSKAQDEKCK